MSITIYHNPGCATSRNTLAMARQSGEEPEVIEYLKTLPSRTKLLVLIAAKGITPSELLRKKVTPYAEVGLAHPILINRPIVVTPWGTKLCWPSEAVLTYCRIRRSDRSPRTTARW